MMMNKFDLEKMATLTGMFDKENVMILCGKEHILPEYSDMGIVITYEAGYQFIESQMWDIAIFCMCPKVPTQKHYDAALAMSNNVLITGDLQCLTIS